ncbi:MAG: uroporphyrinogen-III synthase [Marinilabiliales bacterium]|nr:MAG: uroporphyrinogen-III synthase [Marinilabiliales bacterium]
MKKILISQPEPKNNSPYFELEKKHKVKVDFVSFIQIEGVAGKELRQQKIKFEEIEGVIFTSKKSADHYFRSCKELSYKPSEELKYFCNSESIALYLQNYIPYRKRKIFHGNGKYEELVQIIKKKMPDGNFLIPLSNTHNPRLIKNLDAAGIHYQKAIMFRTVSSDISNINYDDYDLIVFFSPSGIRSLYDNFSDFKQDNMKIAAFGKSTANAVEKAGLRLDIAAPTKEALSMVTAIDNYLKNKNGK